MNLKPLALALAPVILMGCASSEPSEHVSFGYQHFEVNDSIEELVISLPTNQDLVTTDEGKLIDGEYQFSFRNKLELDAKAGTYTFTRLYCQVAGVEDSTKSVAFRDGCMWLDENTPLQGTRMVQHGKYSAKSNASMTVYTLNPNWVEAFYHNLPGKVFDFAVGLEEAKARPTDLVKWLRLKPVKGSQSFAHTMKSLEHSLDSTFGTPVEFKQDNYRVYDDRARNGKSDFVTKPQKFTVSYAPVHEGMRVNYTIVVGPDVMVDEADSKMYHVDFTKYYDQVIGGLDSIGDESRQFVGG